MSADKIHIRNLTLRCLIGVYPRERRAKQTVVVNLVLTADHRRAARSDQLADAVNYKTLKQRIVALVTQSSFRLIETLADRIARACLAEPGVRRVMVTVDKPGALRYARSVAVEITRAK